MLASRYLIHLFPCASGVRRSISLSSSCTSGSQRTFTSSASTMVGFVHNVAQVGFGTGTNELYDKFVAFLPSPLSTISLICFSTLALSSAGSIVMKLLLNARLVTISVVPGSVYSKTSSVGGWKSPLYAGTSKNLRHRPRRNCGLPCSYCS